MDNIIEYVKKIGRLSFEEKPFGPVDSLILSEMSYFKYEGLVPGLSEPGKAAGIKEISHRADFEKMFVGLIDIPYNQALLLAAANSRRFGGMLLKMYVNEIVEEQESQFSAVTFCLDEKNTYVAYRGTDETLIGWKEDFNMGFISPVPAQEAGLKYLETAAAHIKGSFDLGGHSKGGNIAVYAGLKSEPVIQSRIRSIYSHDGPGFKDAVFEEKGYRNIQGKIHKIVPQSSVVGLLFQHQEAHTVVKSCKNGLLQHDPFSWIVEGDDFVYLEEIDKNALFMDKTLNAWISDMDDDARKSFVDAIFNILSATEADTIIELTEEWKKAVMSMIAAAKELDDESKKAMKQTISVLMTMGKQNMREMREKEKENLEETVRRTGEKSRDVYMKIRRSLAHRVKRNKKHVNTMGDH